MAITDIPENAVLRGNLRGPAQELPFSTANTIEGESIEQQPTEQNRDAVDNTNEEGPAAGGEVGTEHDDRVTVPGKKTVFKMAVLTAFILVLVHRLRR